MRVLFNLPPMSSPLSRTSELRSPNDKRPHVRSNLEQGVIRGIEDLVPKKIVEVVVKITPMVHRARSHRLPFQSAIEIVDDVRGVVNVSPPPAVRIFVLANQPVLAALRVAFNIGDGEVILLVILAATQK